MAIASGMEQSIERARVANALAQMGVAQIAVSDVERLVWEAEQAAELRRQLAECQAAASPALIEEYAKACHYAGERNYAAPDLAVWLRRRLEAQVE